MTCREVEELLTLSTATDAANMMQRPVREHIEDCADCQQLARVVELPLTATSLDEREIQRLQRMIASDLRPVRQLPPAWIFLLTFAIVFACMTFIGMYYLKPLAWFVLMPVPKLAIFSTLAASASVLAFSLVRQMIPGQNAQLRPELLPVGLFVLLALVIASVFQVQTDPVFFQAGIGCLRAGAPYAIPAGFLFWLILRRGAVLHPRAVGAIAGMLAGLVGTTVLEFHCEYFNVWHIVVWHVGVSVLGLVAGLLLASLGEGMQYRWS